MYISLDVMFVVIMFIVLVPLLLFIVPFNVSEFSVRYSTFTPFGKEFKVFVHSELVHISYYNSYVVLILFKFVIITLNNSVFPAFKCNILSFDVALLVVILNDKSFTFMFAILAVLLLVNIDNEKTNVNINIRNVPNINKPFSCLFFLIKLKNLIRFSFII